MSTRAVTRKQAHGQPGHHVHPIVATALGGIFEGFCLLGLTMEVSTTEAWLNGKHIMDFTPQWEILNQLPQVFTGGLGPLQGPAFVAWTVAFLWIAFSITGKVLEESMNASGRMAAGFLKFLMGLIVIGDVFTTLNNGPTVVTGGILGHLACLACVLLCILGFGTLGLRLLINHTITFLN